MGFFDTLSQERKLAAIDLRVGGLKEQLFTCLIIAGLDPDSVDMETLNPLTDISEENLGLREQFVNILEALEKLEQIRARIAE